MSEAKLNSSALLGATVEWTEDHRPMPGDYGFTEELLFDMSLLHQERGKVEQVTRSFFGTWKALIHHNGGFIEKNLSDIRIISPNSTAQSPDQG